MFLETQVVALASTKASTYNFCTSSVVSVTFVSTAEMEEPMELYCSNFSLCAGVSDRLWSVQQVH